jgi:hypothetical protein
MGLLTRTAMPRWSDKAPRLSDKMTGSLITEQLSAESRQVRVRLKVA